MMHRFDTVRKKVGEFANCEAGTTAIEYGLIALLIAVAIVGGATSIGTSSIVTLDAVTSVFP